MSVLSRVIGLQLAELQACNNFRDGLFFAKDHAPGVRLSTKARLNGSELAARDVLRSAHGVLLVSFLDVSAVAGWGVTGVIVVADVFDFEADVTRHSTAFVRSSQSALVQISEFSLVHAWYFDGDRCIIAL